MMSNSRRRLSNPGPPSPVQSPLSPADQAVAPYTENDDSKDSASNQSNNQPNYYLPNHPFTNKRQRSSNEEVKTESPVAPFSLTLNSNLLSIITNQSPSQSIPTETRMSPVTQGISNFSVQSASPEPDLKRSRSFAESSTISIHSVNRSSNPTNKDLSNGSSTNQSVDQSTNPVTESITADSSKPIASTSHQLVSAVNSQSPGQSDDQKINKPTLSQSSTSLLGHVQTSPFNRPTAPSDTSPTNQPNHSSISQLIQAMSGPSVDQQPSAVKQEPSNGQSTKQISNQPVYSPPVVMTGTYNNMYPQHYVVFNNQVHQSNNQSLNPMYILNPAMYVQAFNPSLKQPYNQPITQPTNQSTSIPVASPINLLGENIPLIRARTAPPLNDQSINQSVNQVVTSMTQPWPRSHRNNQSSFERYLFHFPDTASHGAQGGLYQPGKPSQLYIELVHSGDPSTNQAPIRHSICLPVKVALKPTVKESATVRRFDELALHPTHLVCPSIDLATEESRYGTGAEVCEPQYLLLRHDWKCPVSVVQVVKYQRSSTPPVIVSPLHLLAVAENSLAHTQTRGRGKNEAARKETAQLYLSFTLNAYYELHAHNGWKIERMLISHYKGGVEVAQSPITFTQLNQETQIADAVSAIQLLAGHPVTHHPTAAARKATKVRSSPRPSVNTHKDTHVASTDAPEQHSPDVETASQFMAALAEQHRQHVMSQRSQSAAPDTSHLALLSSAASQSRF